MWDAQYGSVVVPANMLADQEIQAFEAKLGTLFLQGSSADGHGLDLANATIEALDAVFNAMDRFVSRGFTDYPYAPGAEAAAVIRSKLAEDIGKKLDEVVAAANRAYPGHLVGMPRATVDGHLSKLKQKAAKLAETLCGG